MKMRLLLLTILTIPVFSVQAQNGKDDYLLINWMREKPEQFNELLQKAAEHRVQIIYTQIDRKGDRMQFTTHSFRNNPAEYFYPASTVKLPIAMLALQRLHELNIPGLDMNTTMITETDSPLETPVYNDPTSLRGKPTIAQYVRKILLVSDNDAFNRLYEFLGQDYINRTLQRMGYGDVRIIHRLAITLPEKENRHTNPVLFLNDSGQVLYRQAAQFSNWDYTQQQHPVTENKMGTGYIKGDTLVKEPFDFSGKNRLTLETGHAILMSLLFPESVPAQQRFRLDETDYAFLRKYMSMYPRESVSPVYPVSDYPDSYAKFIYYGGGPEPADTTIRIFSKSGDAYGFMIDYAFLADFSSKSSFLVSACIYANSDGVFNDDHYDYDQISKPFFKNLGRLIHEKEIHRKHTDVFSPEGFRFNYRE